MHGRLILIDAGEVDRPVAVNPFHLDKAQLAFLSPRDREAVSFKAIEILGHLYDTEIVYGYRYRLSLSQPGSPIQGYDQATWVDQLRHRRGNAKRLLERIRVSREGTLEMLRLVPRANWKRYGMHSERGKESVRRTMELIAGHDVNHLGQIKAIRRKYGW